MDFQLGHHLFDLFLEPFITRSPMSNEIRFKVNISVVCKVFLFRKYGVGQLIRYIQTHLEKNPRDAILSAKQSLKRN